MEKERRLELIDNAIQKLIHDNDDKVQGFDHDNNLKDHDAQYQLALSHLLSLSTQLDLETLKRDEKLEQSEASSPSEPVTCVIKKTESENGADGGGEVDEGIRGSEKDEIKKELKKVKRQNFVTHCLLSVAIVLTVAWQLSEVSLILKVKEGINHPFRSFGNMLKDMVKDKVPDINGHVADKNKENNESTSLTSLNIPEMPRIDVPNLGKE